MQTQSHFRQSFCNAPPMKSMTLLVSFFFFFWGGGSSLIVVHLVALAQVQNMGKIKRVMVNQIPYEME